MPRSQLFGAATFSTSGFDKSGDAKYYTVTVTPGNAVKDVCTFLRVAK